jgi:XTP/dITP diphosphohydrolase
MLSFQPRSLVIATTNLGKLREIRSMLAELSVQLYRPLDVLGYMPEIVEDGAQFEDNALLKAKGIAQLTGYVTLADDSGLEVDALGGLPGVRSARFAGEQATDADNNAALVRAMMESGVVQSSARFRCAMALVSSRGELLSLKSGVCEGVVQLEARGTTGFGYDPLFVVTELGSRTMAELSEKEKNAVSHRGRALRAILPELQKAVSESIASDDVEVTTEL